MSINSLMTLKQVLIIWHYESINKQIQTKPHAFGSDVAVPAEMSFLYLVIIFFEIWQKPISQSEDYDLYITN